MSDDDAIRQLEAIRRSGLVNMMRRTAVQRIADASGFHALVTAIEDGDYAALLEQLPHQPADEADIPTVYDGALV